MGKHERRYKRVDRFERLPDHVQRIVRAVLSARTRTDAAAELAMSMATVHTAMHHAYSALGIHDGTTSDKRDRLAAEVRAADQRAAAPNQLAGLTDSMLEVYQTCRRIEDEMRRTGAGSPLLHRRLELALTVARQQLLELRGEQAGKGREAA
jgi:hypothetical protein